MMDKARIQSEKQRVEDNKRKLSRLSYRENNDDTGREDSQDNPTNRFDYIFKIVIIGDAVRIKPKTIQNQRDIDYHSILIIYFNARHYKDKF